MSYRDTATPSRPARLLWVAIIAFTAALITTWLRTGAVGVTLALALASAAISVGVVWVVDRVRGRA